MWREIVQKEDARGDRQITKQGTASRPLQSRQPLSDGSFPQDSGALDTASPRPATTRSPPRRQACPGVSRPTSATSDRSTSTATPCGTPHQLCFPATRSLGEPSPALLERFPDSVARLTPAILSQELVRGASGPSVTLRLPSFRSPEGRGEQPYLPNPNPNRRRRTVLISQIARVAAFSL